MWSSIVTLPYLKPDRDFGSRCGAWVIDSIPPATTMSHSPARISWSANAIAFRPERHTLFTVMAGTDIADPALDRRLPSGELAGARLQDLPHHHVVDLLGTHPGTFQGGRDGPPAEVSGREVLQSAHQLADRRTRPTNDD